jgi:hypothetical protein
MNIKRELEIVRSIRSQLKTVYSQPLCADLKEDAKAINDKLERLQRRLALLVRKSDG